MASKYNDIITLSKSRTVYNIREEGPKDWETFIANAQFNGLLDKTIKSVFNNAPDNHKPIWIAGTYGTGKSHAGAVIKHLMCDPIENILDYVNLEYKDSKFDMLRTNLLTLRGNKRLFPVSLYGQQQITHVSDLSLQLQREIKNALVAAGIDIVVQTDFDTYVSHIDENPGFWEMIIGGDAQLASVAPTVQKLRSELQSCETGTLDILKDALRKGRYHINLEASNISKWIVEVQNKLREKGVADGLFIVWDEFTSICTSSIGVKLLEEIQEISEVMMTEDNDSYFFFISHPSALNLLSEDKRNQTIGRYHYVSYNMEPVSAFKIMSRKFNVIDEAAHSSLVREFYDAHSELLDIFSSSSNQQEETKQDIQKLYPLHPSTANLATFYAREAGSSSRSVFEFLACDAVREFFDNESVYQNYSTVTPDYLWDYVLEVFNEDSVKFGAVTERYNSYHLRVEHQGYEYAAVFKGILLLNALNNIANHDTVTPTVENIKNLFIGTEIEINIDEVLDFFNEKSIIQRLPGDVFSIQFTALPGDEIEKYKQQLTTSEYKFTEQVAKFADIATTDFNKAWANIARPFRVEIFSQQANEYTLQNKIENIKKTVKGYELFIAVLVAKNFDELSFLKTFAQNANINGKFKDMVLVVFDAVMEQQNYDRFIDFMANAKCAAAHSLAPQHDTYVTNGKKLVKEWIGRIKGGNFTCYINGQDDTAAGVKFVSTMNNCVSPLIFTAGPESLQLIQTKFSKTYWKKAAVKTAVDAMLQFNTKNEIVNKAGGQGKHVELLLQDSVDENLEWKDDVNPEHPLKKVCEFIDKVFKYTNKNQEFNLGEKLIELSQPPYGLYQSYAGMSMVAFAMRKYVKQIFDTSGKPREARHIVDDVVELFKAWEDGKKSNKLNLMFESKESSSLCKRFISIFKLNKLTGYKDVSSLTDARWALLSYANQQGYPLWALKYSGCSDELAELVDNINKVCDPTGLSNQELINTTSKAIKNLEIDLSVLLNKENVFRTGFVNFLKMDEVAKVQDHEIDQVYIYLKQHLQGEIGRWSESEVKAQEKNWRIETLTSTGQPDIPVTPVVPSDNGGNSSDSGDSTNTGGESLSTLRETMLKKVQAINAYTLKEAIESMVESEGDYILNTLMKYVR